MRNYFFSLLIIFGFVSLLNAQEVSQPNLIKKFQEQFQNEYLSLNMLFQTVVDYQAERTGETHNGFSVENMRLSLSGNLDERWHYQVQVNFVKAPSLLDANLSYRLNQSFGVKIGRFKAPFSKEYLTSAANIDFVNRSQVVAQLAPGRQVGVQLAGAAFNSMLNYQFGIFNGNQGSLSGNDNNAFLYAGRISLIKKNHVSPLSLEIGMNASISNDRDLMILSTNFSGERRLIGADARAQVGSLLLACEYIHADLEGITPSGYYGTVGWGLNKKNQLLVRFDCLQGDGMIEDRDLYIGGWNFNPSPLIGFQVNYIIEKDLNQLKHHQILVNVQMAI